MTKPCKYKFISSLKFGSLKSSQVYEAGRSDELVAYQMDKTEIQPHEGWCEQDPLEIMHHIKLCAENACDQLVELGKGF